MKPIGTVAKTEHTIAVRDVKATWFGGGIDAGDNSKGVWGFDSKLNADVPGVALPMDGFHIASLVGSPIPRLAPFTPVHVFSHKTSKSAWAFLVDVGPSGFTGHGLDMTPALLDLLGLSKDDGVYDVDYRIVLP